MREVVVYALYVWVAISIVALVVQQVRRIRHRRTAARQPRTNAAVPAAETASALIEKADAAATVDVETVGTPVADVVRMETAGSSDDTASDPDTLKVPAPANTAVGQPPDLPRPEVVLGTPSPASDMPMAAADAKPASSGITQLLAGIQLPNDLLPVIPSGAEPSDNHVSLITSTVPADVVGPAMADELERLGYELESVSESKLIARRGDDLFTLRMVVSPTTAVADGTRLYPSARDGDVVIAIDAGPDHDY